MAHNLKTLFYNPQIFLLLFGIVFSFLWHFSLIYLSPFSLFENSGQVKYLFFYYLYLHAGLVFSLSIWGAFRQKSSRWFFYFVVLIYALYQIVRSIDWVVLYYYGGHVDPLFWDNAFYASGLNMLKTWAVLLSSISVCTGLIIFTLLAGMGLKHQSINFRNGMSLQSYLIRFCLLPTTIFMLIGNLIIDTKFSKEGSSVVYTQLPPEFHFVKSIADYIRQGYAVPVELNDETKTKLASMGLTLESISKEYPFLRSSVYMNDFPCISTHEKPPNVIIVIAESFSSYFLESPIIRAMGITPNIDAFAQKSCYFSNIVNANTPTLQGQIATLASSLHVFKTTMNMKRWGQHEDIKEQNNTQDGSLFTRYPFLSLLLKDHGYNSVHIQGGDARFADTEHYFRLSAGYDDFISVADSQYADQRLYKLGPWGAIDADTFRIVTQWLESKKGGPFLMTISTMDIHHPYTPTFYKSGVENDLLNTVYSTDAGFGIFWEYFRNSKFKSNTILIFTSDHAIFPTNEYLALRGKDVGYYDKIPLLIYSPFNDLPMNNVDSVRGTQLDVAPTLFELLGLDSPNAFLGLSLLSDRRNHPYLFGKVNLSSRFKNSAKISWTDEEQTQLINYIQYQASKNRLFPQINYSADQSFGDLLREQTTR
jgi:phosphoglycerol transferase MdoB-like AlkP superfamily enzyme